MPHLLILEEDHPAPCGLYAQLGAAGHMVSIARDKVQALAILEAMRCDMVIIDLCAQAFDGIAVLRSIRQRFANMAVLVLTAHDGVAQRVAALNAGADDYLSKPIDMHELQACIAANVSRERVLALDAALEVQLPHAVRLRVDALLPMAWLNDRAVQLTQREWSLLMLLVNDQGQVVRYEEVLAQWQAAPAEGSTAVSAMLEVYISRLRRKLGDAGISIHQISGTGYMLELDTETT